MMSCEESSKPPRRQVREGQIFELFFASFAPLRFNLAALWPCEKPIHSLNLLRRTGEPNGPLARTLLSLHEIQNSANVFLGFLLIGIVNAVRKHHQLPQWQAVV